MLPCTRGSLWFFLGAIVGCGSNASIAAAPCKPEAATKAAEWSIPEGKLVTVVLAPKSSANDHTYEAANMQQVYYDIKNVDGHAIESLRIHVVSSEALPTSEATVSGYFFREVAPFSVVQGFSDVAQQGYPFRYDLNLRIKPTATPHAGQQQR